MNQDPHGWFCRNGANAEREDQTATFPVYETNAEHVHFWSFVPNGVVIDWRVQSWRVLRHCTSCDEFQNVTLALDA